MPGFELYSLCTHPEDWGTDAMVLRDVAIQVASLQVQQDIFLALQQNFHLFALTSTSKSTPDDKYLAELKYLKDELDMVKAAQAYQSNQAAPSAPAGPGGVTWGLGLMNLVPIDNVGKGAKRH
jgi:hypothetical protein